MKHKGTGKDTHQENEKCVPFESAEEAWFWFIAAQQARNDGARFVSGLGLVSRPCEPVDILKILDRLHRQRRLLMDHLLVLRHYGRRTMAPDPRRVKEARAYDLWTEALERLGYALQKKGIVRERSWITQHIKESRSYPAQETLAFGIYPDPQGAAGVAAK